MPMAVPSSVHRSGRRAVRCAEFAVLVAIFTASFALRLPYLDRPLSYHFEWLSAHTLMVHEISHEQGGPARHLFAQLMNYGKLGDLYVNNAAMSNHYPGYPSDGKGRYYYLSHPVLGLVAPYYVAFALWDVRPNVLGLQLFNLGVQFLCAWFVYLIVLRAAEVGDAVNFPALIGAGLYLLLPGLLWFHGNTYYVETFAQLPFIVSVYLAQAYLRDPPGVRSGYRLAALGAAVLATVLSEWLGYLLAATLVGYGLYSLRRSKDWAFIVVVFISVALGLVLYVLPHGVLIGFGPLVRHLIGQFLYQSAGSTSLAEQMGMHIHTGLTGIVHNYWAGAGPGLVLVVVLAVAAYGALRSQAFWDRFGRLLLVVGGPALAHHVLLSRFTAEHWYSMLKGV